MGTIEIIGAVALILVCLAVVISVVLQESQGGGLGALGGGSTDSYMDKNKTRTNEATLSMISKYSGIALFVITIAVLFISIKG